MAKNSNKHCTETDIQWPTCGLFPHEGDSLLEISLRYSAVKPESDAYCLHGIQNKTSSRLI